MGSVGQFDNEQPVAAISSAAPAPTAPAGHSEYARAFSAVAREAMSVLVDLNIECLGFRAPAAPAAQQLQLDRMTSVGQTDTEQPAVAMSSAASAPAAAATIRRCVSRPPNFVGWVRKPKRGLSKFVGFNAWTTRFFKLCDGRLFWSSAPAASVEEMAARHAFIDFASTPTVVQIRRESKIRLAVLRPMPGHVWSHSDRNTRAGTDEPLILNVFGSGSSTWEWVDMIRQHIAFAAGRDGLSLSVSAVLRPVRSQDSDEDDCCPICLENLSSEEFGNPVQSTCGHRFHNHCCREWLLIEGSCPVCRAQLLGQAPMAWARSANSGARASTRSVRSVLAD